uniref:Secreted protein n=1 Tax=Hordeum vulgare subsp. vulgare TaxID=112509 RepID=A0A8I7B8U0_HORVV
MKRSSSSPSSLACVLAILLAIVCCCSMLPLPCSAMCKGRAFRDFGQGPMEGQGGEGGNHVDQEGAYGPGGAGNGGGGNQVGRTPPAPRGRTPRNHR